MWSSEIPFFRKLSTRSPGGSFTRETPHALRFLFFYFYSQSRGIGASSRGGCGGARRGVVDRSSLQLFKFLKSSRGGGTF